MRTLTLTAAGIAASMFLAFSAQAATLTMVADKSTYNISETITLTITGDSTGGSANAIFGTVEYGGLTSANGGQVQGALTSFGGAVPWLQGQLFVDAPHANTQDSFNQTPGLNPFPIDQLLVATMTFHADAAGVANFSWRTLAGNERLNFFGLTNAAGTSVTIVPEPTTAALLGIGLFGLAVAGRRR
jgi:hypothetical protein